MRTYGLVLFAAVAATHAMAFTDSGWKQIGESLGIPLVQDLGKWAVDEYNRETGEHLAFTRTVAAGQQSDAKGLYLQLIIEGAVRVGTDNYFKAVVSVDTGNPDKRELLTFDAARRPK